MSETRTRILVVDDEVAIRRFLRTGLGVHGFAVSEAESGATALQQATIVLPDLIVLDLQLGDMDGLDVLARLREWSSVPVFILSVRARETEKVRAFELGADDYIVKPFGMAEFVARVKSALRRRQNLQEAEPMVTLGDLSVDLAHRIVTMRGQMVKLSPMEYKLLSHLARHSGKVLTHDQLLRHGWGAEHVGDVHYLRIFMRKLRRKIEPDPTRPRYIATELGVGYRLLNAEQELTLVTAED
ncbi:response regulator [Ferrovibrio sp.]|uniref:response regulator n=1 Tax=Ferrovibrio sp. TaxID=1917215 RepID=UPI0025C55501|nr:response regulator [Ferrovibrio sp.]MBX3455473.1 response regulator [Ferrovibrio sp.]